MCYSYSPSFEKILTKESNDYKLKRIKSLLITLYKLVLNKANFSLSLKQFYYHIMWCLSSPLCRCKPPLFSFQNYVVNVTILPKLECIGIYYHFQLDHKSSNFWKLAVNKWIFQNIFDDFLDEFSSLAITSNTV